jgi:poly-beta-1,6-N-acetyl-D-glucosamine synthase
MTVLMIIAFILLFIYFLLLGSMAAGYLLTNTIKNVRRQQSPVTVIVCARNEGDNIARCLLGILSQEYEKDLLQLIVVNDGSSDNTGQIAERILSSSGPAHILINNAVSHGKKTAVTQAVRQVVNPLIVLRDADTSCESTHWLAAISDFYSRTQCDLIIGPLTVSPAKGLLWALQATENKVLGVLTAGSAYFKKPFLCNGANLAFTKKTFNEVKGFASHMHLVSGDDIFFLEDVKKNEGKIGYLKDPDAVVTTLPLTAPVRLLRQKLRWASKYKYNSNRLNLLLAAVTFFVNAVCVISPIVIIYSPSFRNHMILFVVIKLFIDLLLLFLTSGFLRSRGLGKWLLPVAVIYPLYACVVGLGSMFVKPRW